MRMYPLTLSERNRNIPRAALDKLAVHGVEAIRGCASHTLPNSPRRVVLPVG